MGNFQLLEVAPQNNKRVSLVYTVKLGCFDELKKKLHSERVNNFLKREKLKKGNCTDRTEWKGRRFSVFRKLNRVTKQIRAYSG